MNYKATLQRAMTVGVLLASLVSVPAGAIAVGGIGGRPANPDPDNPRTQSIFIMTLERGQTGKDAVLVVNNSGETQTIRLYAVDGLTTNTGSYTCRQESDARIDLGKWTKLSKSEVTLATGKTVEVPFSITTPSSADVGEHNGCIVFEAKDDASTNDTADGGNVQVKTRQALRVAVTIPGDLKRDISIDDFTVTKTDSQPTYNVNVNNTGNVSADVDVKVSIKSLLGGEVYTNGGGYPVLSNTDLNLAFVQEDTPMFGGFYTARATVSYGAEIGTIGTDTGEVVTKTSEQRLVFIAPSPTGALIMFFTAASMLAALVWYVRRHLRHKTVVRAGDTYTVKTGDTIQSVAEQHDMRWKHLAAANKVKAPYVLKEGQLLYVSAKKPQRKK